MLNGNIFNWYNCSSISQIAKCSLWEVKAPSQSTCWLSQLQWTSTVWLLKKVHDLSVGFATELKKQSWVSSLHLPKRRKIMLSQLPKREKFMKSTYFSFKGHIFLFVTKQISPELQPVVLSNIFLLQNPARFKTCNN